MKESKVATELVEGPTLAERVKQGLITIDEGLRIAKQIAEALGRMDAIVTRAGKTAFINDVPDRYQFVAADRPAKRMFSSFVKWMSRLCPARAKRR